MIIFRPDMYGFRSYSSLMRLSESFLTNVLVITLASQH
jgi:hypothetical protein